MNAEIDARGTTTSITSSAWLLFATQNAFSRASISSWPAPGGSTKTSIAPSSASSSPTACTSSSRRSARAFSSTTTRYASALPRISSGTPSFRPSWLIIAAIVRMSMYSSISGPTPLATTLRHRGGHFVERREGREQRRGVRESRVEPQDGLRDQRERALRADQQLRQVVAGRRLDQLAAAADHLAGGEHRFDAEHVVARDAVLHRAHAARVGRDVAAEARAVLARVDRIDEAVRGELRVELIELHARLDDARRRWPRRPRGSGSCARTRRRCRRAAGCRRPRGRCRRRAPSPGTPCWFATRRIAATCSVVAGRSTAAGRVGVGGERLVVGVVVVDRVAGEQLVGADDASRRARAISAAVSACAATPR